MSAARPRSPGRAAEARGRVRLGVALAIVAGVVLSLSCGDSPTGSGPSPPPPPPLAPVPTTVNVTPGSAELSALDATVQLSAEVRDQSGSAVPGAAVSWSSGDAAVATVDASGLVTAVANGTATVAATAGSASGRATVTVVQAVDSVTVSPPSATVAPGDTVRLSAEALDANGHPAAGAEFSWSSSDESVATVDASGLVTGVAAGSATVTAAAGDVRGTSEISVANSDRAALVALYDATDGPNWVNNENWLTDAPLGEWYGVAADRRGRVVELSMENNRLSGPIPAEIGDLDSLTRLSLAHNDLTGSIPPELGNLGSLFWLSLRNNRLTGPIPEELGGLAELTALWLPANELSGPIPAELGNLFGLRGLSLAGNRLTGPIPPELGNLGRLQTLYLWRNNFSGPIPFSFLQLRLINFFIGENAGLCVPPTPAFDAWLKGLDNHDAGPTSSCDAGDRAALESLYEATGGPGWTESDGWLGDGSLDDWYGVTADSLGRVTELDLTRNGLEGRLPASLGDLTAMTALRIGGNALSGRLSQSLAKVPLQELDYADTDLCAPSEPAFQAWLSAIPSRAGPDVDCTPLSDRDVLQILYDVAGGPNWTNNGGWLTDAPLREWHGVGVDGGGRVTSLFLAENNLTGPIPPELGNLAHLNTLWIGVNALRGEIPPELGKLANLEWLYLSGNQLTGSIPPELGDLASLEQLWLSVNRLSGSIPPELGNLASLVRLNLYDNRLEGAIPPELGRLANLRNLSLPENALTGAIPAALGDLANLEELFIGGNAYGTSIPPELGRLGKLRRLSIAAAGVTGTIPPELGNLASLEYMWLNGNALTGPMPPELGNLSNLGFAFLGDNRLTGVIPPELARLDNLKHLHLDENHLSGPLPSELGDLRMLEELHLESNDFAGSVPAEFGGMSSLEVLGLTNNPRLAGVLPADLTELSRLSALLAGNTGLCAPSDPGFQAWLRGVYKQRITACAEGAPPAAYLVQAVQSREFPVPLVAGERALLRVFPTAARSTSAGIPPVRARFHVDGREVHVADIPGKSAPIPTGVDEGSLAKSANAEIPGEVVRPGLEMVVEIDPDGTLDSSLGVARRIPETGRLAVDVREMPLFDLTLIPFVWTQTGDSSIVDLVREMAADPENHELLDETRTLLPVRPLAVTAHEPVLSSSNSAFAIRDETKAIRVIEGGAGHYMGMMSRPVTGAAGVAFLPGKSSFSVPAARTIAHELGHNLSLYHAPCGNAAGPDRSFPYPDGSIGAWGYDFRDGGGLVSPSTPDLMTYCGPPDGLSDYHFTNALKFRLSEADSVGLPDRAPPAQSLLLWGGIEADSVPFLEPAFVVDAPPTLPNPAGDYRVSGHSERGVELFSLAFAMPEVADGDGSSSFAFALPVRPGWESGLASVTLTGPGGSVTLDGASDRPMAILRDPRTGQVRGILRDLPPTTLTRADAAAAVSPEPGLEVLFSRGIPDAEAWRK